MTERGTTKFAFDACVLIDYWEADKHSLATLVQHVAPIHLATPVLDEVRQISREDAEELGLTLTTPSLEVVDEAVNSATIRLSWQDMLCARMALDEGCTCVTNDTALHLHCEAIGVESIWGLRPLLLAVAASACVAQEARRIALAIRESNPAYITGSVIRAFEAELAKLEWGQGSP